MNIWHVYDLKYFENTDPRNPSGDRNYPWPDWFSDKYDKHRAGPGNPELFFHPASLEEQNFLADAHANSILFSMKKIGKWDAKHIDRFRFYEGTAPRGDSPIFKNVSNIFENQLDCDWPMPVGNLLRPNGCGNAKMQLRKLVAPENGKFPKYDIFNLNLFVRAPQCQTAFAVSSKFRETLIKNEVTGIKLVPILKSGISWTTAEMQFDFMNERILETSDYFQLVIMASTAPVQMSFHSDELVACTACSSVRTVGRDRRASQEVLAATFLSKFDFQAEQSLITTDGVVFRFSAFWKYYISSRVVRLLAVENSLALRSHPGKYGKFLPVLIEGEF